MESEKLYMIQKFQQAHRQNFSHVVMIISDDQEGAIEISALASTSYNTAHNTAHCLFRF